MEGELAFHSVSAESLSLVKMMKLDFFVKEKSLLITFLGALKPDVLASPTKGFETLTKNFLLLSL